MKHTLSARHLLRVFVLFALTLVCLLSMTRSALSLWYYNRLIESDALIDTFVTGLRFDLALVGFLLLVPCSIGVLLALGDSTRVLARWLITGILVAGVCLAVIGELLTPWSLAEHGMRPGIAALDEPMEQGRALVTALQAHPVPSVIAGVLAVLIIVAFAARLEPRRLLSKPLSPLSGLMLMVMGTVICGIAILGGTMPEHGPMNIGDSLVSSDTLVNELSLNSLYKLGLTSATRIGSL